MSLELAIPSAAVLYDLFRFLEFPHFDETINQSIEKAFFVAYKEFYNSE
jgi:hypothetical protein